MDWLVDSGDYLTGARYSPARAALVWIRRYCWFMDVKAHWEKVFLEKAAGEMSWYAPHLEHSLRWIRALRLPRTAAILDVGAGESTLVDDLLAEGFSCVTTLDVSKAALERVRRRLGERANTATWIVGDVTEVSLPEAHYDVWHDRAVFHFLVERERRAQYVAQMRRALKPGGRALISTFGPEGPARCSGLEVCRYDAASLAAELGERFRLEEAEVEMHRTPAGRVQEFLHTRFVYEPTLHAKAARRMGHPDSW